MSAGRGGGITGRAYDTAASILAAATVCTLVLVLMLGPAKGVATAGKGVDVVTLSFGAVIGYIGRAVDGVTKGQSLAAKDSPKPAAKAPANKSAPAAAN